MGAWKKWQSCCRAQTDIPRPRSDPKEKKNFQKITDRQTSSWFHHHLNLVQMRETKIYFSYLPHTTWQSVLLLWCASSYLITLKFVKCLTVTNTHTQTFSATFWAWICLFPYNGYYVPKLCACDWLVPVRHLTWGLRFPFFSQTPQVCLPLCLNITSNCLRKRDFTDFLSMELP